MAETIGELKIKLSADIREFDEGIRTAKSALESMETTSSATGNKVANLVPDIANSIAQSSPKMAAAGSVAFGALTENIPTITEEILGAVPYVMDKVCGEFEGYNVNMIGIGTELVAGIGLGISQSTGALLVKIHSFGQSVLGEMESVFDIASPSKKTIYLGQMIGEGLAAGITKSLGSVELSASALYGAAMIDAPSTSNTYNTYNTTYQATTSSNAVNMADFENRIRRAYA